MTFDEHIAEMIKYTKKQGFYTPSSIEEVEALLVKLFLVVTELSEAAEAVRHGNEENFREEIADVFIRMFDIVGHMQIDIEKEIEKKMTYNWKRPWRHGKKA